MPNTMRLRLGRLALAALAASVLSACLDDPTGPRASNPDWTSATHGKVDPNYAVVFPAASVNELRIDLGAAGWDSVRADMVRLVGADFGRRTPDWGNALTRDPAYVEATVEFGGRRWTHVGFRLKGYSSLLTAWQREIYKLPFRLDFDRFEERYPAFRNQRFYGFKELSMASGYGDDSLIREQVVSDLFRTGGVPTARTAFYRVYINFGAGYRYCGVYTMVEAIDDSMVRGQFGEDDGNLYQPTSRYAAFVQEEFEKKNNKASADYSDVQALTAALNSDVRMTSAAAWRAQLEATFDVDHFLRWLALRNAVVDGDCYGITPRNSYLYHHSRRQLVWIPWDHNLALNGRPGLTGDPAAPRGPWDGLSLTMNEVGPDWPLIRYLMDDSVYAAKYRAHLREVGEVVLAPERVDGLLTRAHSAIAPYVVGSAGERPGYTMLSSPAAFEASLLDLQARVRERRALVTSFVP